MIGEVDTPSAPKCLAAMNEEAASLECLCRIEWMNRYSVVSPTIAASNLVPAIDPKFVRIDPIHPFGDWPSRPPPFAPPWSN